MKITFKSKGSFDHLEEYLNKKQQIDFISIMEKYGELGVNALSAATPYLTGETASSWYYIVSKTSNGYSLMWNNSHIVGGVPLVLLLQYGHGTSSGAYVQGRDFINPALRPILDKLTEELWKEVVNG